MKKTISVLMCVLLTAALCIPAIAGTGSKHHYVLLGDSIAQGYGIYNRDRACYGRIVADSIGATYANYGVDGLRSWDLIEMLKEDDVKKDVRKATIISLSIGGNDYLQQNLPRIAYEVLQDNYKIPDDIERDFIGYFAEIISMIRKLNPGAVLLVQTLYNPEFGALGDFYGIATERVNRNIRDYLKKHPKAFYLIDTCPVMENHPECIAADTIHPSAVGNVRLAKLILDFLYEKKIISSGEAVINKPGIDEIPFSSYVAAGIAGLFR